MSNDLAIYEFDKDLDWIIQRFPTNTKPFFSFSVAGSKETYNIQIIKFYSPNTTFPKMTITNEDETFFEKRIKAGLQYEINEDIAIYFQILNIDINTINNTVNYQNNIFFGYALI